MAKYSSTSVVFKIDLADSGALQDITAYLTKIGDVNVNKGLIETTPFGTSSATFLQGVFKKYDEIALEGYYDDTASTGPDAILNIGAVTHAVTRSFELTIGGSKKLSGECWITAYKRGFAVGDYTTFSATIIPTGTITEA